MNLLGDFFMKVKAKLAFAYYNHKEFPSMCFLRLKVLWSDRIKTLIDSKMYSYLDMCTKTGNDMEEQYLYIRVNTRQYMINKKFPTKKFIRHLSIDSPCHYVEDNDFSIGILNPTVILFDVIIDLDILRDNTECCVGDKFKRVLEEILWKSYT